MKQFFDNYCIGIGVGVVCMIFIVFITNFIHQICSLFYRNRRSEFGKGIVVCLARFSEHFNDHWYRKILESNYRLDEKALSVMIILWANGASNHFQELDDKAPPSLKKLANLCFEIRSSFIDEMWTWETIVEIRKLWEKSLVEVDEMLGVKSDFGEN